MTHIVLKIFIMESMEKQEEINHIIEEAEISLKKEFAFANEICQHNQEKVIDAFAKSGVALRHFNGSSGYGIGDEGRHVLGQVFADAMGAESGIVSPALLSGTHTLAVALFGLLRPGDRALAVTGLPYDTLRGVIFGENNGSLKDLGIKFDLLDLNAAGAVDFISLEAQLKNAGEDLKMIYIQRSRGYELRNALTVAEIGEICSFVRAHGFKGIIFVDNCYGEFVEKQEPCEVGADVAAGSLIKNPGGGLAPTGGYIVGKKEYLERIGNRLTAPSLGDEVGSYAYGYRLFFQGIFMAPHVVNQAVKGSLLIGKCMEKLGYENFPKFGRTISDITRAIRFDTKKQLCDFISSVQAASPVDAFAVCEPCEMPGYEAQVIMAAGCFVEGASIELSADAPIREPYTAYFQGGLTYEHAKYALKKMLAKLI